MQCVHRDSTDAYYGIAVAGRQTEEVSVSLNALHFLGMYKYLFAAHAAVPNFAGGALGRKPRLGSSRAIIPTLRKSQKVKSVAAA